MAVLADGRFWAGVIVGLILYWAWLKYQERQAAAS